MSHADKDCFPPREFGDSYRAAFVVERTRYAVGCPKCGKRTDSETKPTDKKPVVCHDCGLKLTP